MPLELFSLDSFRASLQHRLSKPLPGKEAHELMRAVPDSVARSRFTHNEPPREGGVLLLLHQGKQGIEFPLILRTDYGGTHSGQVSLPGGKVEESETFQAAALRETMEEIGIEPTKVEIIGNLSPYFVIPSNFMVYPFVGIHSGEINFKPDPREVKQMLSMSVQDLLHENAVSRSIVKSGPFSFEAPHFTSEGHIVWGATAMILSEFRTIVKET